MPGAVLPFGVTLGGMCPAARDKVWWHCPRFRQSLEHRAPITLKGGGPKNPSRWLCRAWHIPCEQSCCPRPGTHSVAPSVPACFWQPAGFPGHRAQPPLPKIRLEQEGWSWNWGSNRLLGAEGMVLGLVLVCLGPTTAGDGHGGNGH